MKKQKILVNLDSLMDTRLGCVRSINPDWVDPLLEGGYLKRLHNTLSFFNKDINDRAVEERWKTRDMEVLRNSYSTNILNLLIHQCSINNNSDPEHPEAQYISIVVNTHPYQFTKDELVTFFIYLKSMFGIERLTQVSMPTSELTPTYLKGNINRFIFHDQEEWNDHQLLNLPHCPIPNTAFNTPLCYRKGMENTGVLPNFEKWAAMGYAAHFKLELLPLADFSICPPLE